MANASQEIEYKVNSLKHSDNFDDRMKKLEMQLKEERQNSMIAEKAGEYLEK